VQIDTGVLTNGAGQATITVNPTATSTYTATSPGYSSGTATVTVVPAGSESLTATDPTWNGTQTVSTNYNPASPTTLPVGTRTTQGNPIDGNGGVQFSMAGLAPGATYDWSLWSRGNPAIVLGDDTAHSEPGSGTFSAASNQGKRTYMSPGGYYLLVTKEGDSSFSRRIDIDVIGIYFTFTTLPTTQPVIDEKKIGGYVMVDTSQPTTAPSGSSNASVVLSGPSDVQGTWKLDYSDSIAVWQGNPDGSFSQCSAGTPSPGVTLSTTIPLKIQGLTASTNERDVQIKCTFAQTQPSSGFTMNDTAQLTVASLEILDAQGFGPNMSGTLDGDPTAAGGTPMQGSLTDGASVLLVRLKPNLHANVGLSVAISHNNPNPAFPQTPGFIGTISANFPPLPAGGSTTSATLGAQNPKVFFFCPPNDFWFGKSNNQQSLVVTTTMGGLAANTATLQLQRPTIMIGHGLCSDQTAVAAWGAALQAPGGANVAYFSYQSSNDSGYEVNSPKLQTQIATVIQSLRSGGIAATRVDYAGHSMGGVIAKWYAADFSASTIMRKYGFLPMNWAGQSQCHRADNFGVGDLHRVLTVGSPLLGSPWGALLSPRGFTKCFVLETEMGGQGDGDAIYDLGSGSEPTLRLLNSNPSISWCPIVGSAAPNKDASNLAPNWVNALAPFLKYLHLTLIGFDAAAHRIGCTAAGSDAIVQNFSQSDGAIGGGHPDPNVVHTDEPSDAGLFRASILAFDLYFDTPNDFMYGPGSQLFRGHF
jgi:pimeloyl-ACP methyl ester carboxylesterase